MIQTIYRRQQAFVFAFGIAMVFVGVTYLIFPGNDLALVQAGVPALVRTLDHIGYVLGGFMLALGIARARRVLEAAGHILIAGLFLAVAWVTVREVPSFAQGVGALGFVLSVSIGSAIRAYLLLSDDGH